MKLSKVALLALRGMDRATRKRLAIEMGVTEDTIYRWMRSNDDSFTKAANLAILRKEFGLSDADLLEQDEVAA
jgi:transcriptional regulator with XRE-family HTH domain